MAIKMDANTKIWKVSAAILVFLNLALLFTIWLKPGNPEPRHMPEAPIDAKGTDLITEQLNFNAGQLGEFQKLKKFHRDSVEKLLKMGHEMRNIFFNQLKTDSADQKIIAEYAMKIANNQRDIEQLTFDHFKEVRKLCDKNQKKIFDEIIDDVLKRMARGPGGRRKENREHRH
jgi:protein CpxP